MLYLHLFAYNFSDYNFFDSESKFGVNCMCCGAKNAKNSVFLLMTFIFDVVTLIAAHKGGRDF